MPNRKQNTKNNNTAVKYNNDQKEINYSYPYHLKYTDFEQNKLIAVQTAYNYSNKIYFYYDPNKIVNYGDIDKQELNKFITAASSPQFCRPVGQAGLKYLGEQKDSIFTHELKINRTDNRILCYTLKSTDGGPTIIVAERYKPGGVHNDKDMKRDYKIESPVKKNTPITQPLTKVGFFAPSGSDPKPIVLTPASTKQDIKLYQAECERVSQSVSTLKK